MANALAPETPARQAASFIAKFDPKIAHIARKSRQALRRRLPTAVELVYDNFHALVFAFGSSERPADCLVSLAVYPSRVLLNFFDGAELPDPENVLMGSGDKNRYVVVDSDATITQRAVEALICAAIAHAPTPLPATAKGPTIIRSVSARQRSRRAS